MEIFNLISTIISVILVLAVCAVEIIAMWHIFEKAGRSGWLCLIPVYNVLVGLQILKKPVWWLILLLILGVNVVVYIILCYNLAKAFGRPSWHTPLIVILPFVYLPVIAFTNMQYQEQ